MSSQSCRTSHLGICTVALVCLLAVTAPSRAREVFPGRTWEFAESPDKVGWSAEKLREADSLARTLPTDAYLVVHRGVVVHQYGKTERGTNIHSIRKSILSVLIGLYVDRGVISLDKTLAELDIDDKQGLSAVEKRATVRQLLQARSGVFHPAGYETAAMAERRPPRGSKQPGEHWYYNNWDFNALGTVFRRTTGKTVFESLRDDLAEPLEFEDFSYLMDTRWDNDPVSEHRAYLIRLSARDLARVGLLMARQGRWRDRQFLSVDWVKESTTSYSNVSARTGYGYMWWIGIGDLFYFTRFPGKVFAAEGNQGQFMVVDPVRDLVVVHRVNSEHDRNRTVSGRQFGELLQLIVAAMPHGE